MKRKLALTLAFALVFTSVPTSGLTGFAEEVLILEDEVQEENGDSLVLPEEDVLLIEEVEETVVENAVEVPEAGGEEVTAAEDSADTESGSDLMGEFLIEDPETEAIQEQEILEEDVLDLGSDGDDEGDGDEEDDEEEEEGGFWIDVDESDTWEEVFPGTPETVHFYMTVYPDDGVELSYQWYYEGEVQDEEDGEWYTDWIKMENETSYELFLNNVEKSGKYLCVVSAGGYEESVKCEVMYNSVVVEKQYNTVEADENGTAVLNVKATSVLNNPITYNWTIWSEEEGYIEIENTADSDTFTVKYEEGGTNEYSCFLSDGNAESFVNFIVVPCGAPIVESSARYEVDFGGSVTLKADVIANKDGAVYQWYFCGSLFNEYEEPVKLKDETKAELTLTNVTTIPGTMDSDFSNLIYKCVVTRNGYTASVSPLVHVNYEEDSLYVYGYGTKKVKPGDAVTLGFSRISNTGGELSFQWYQFDKNYNQVKLEGETGRTLELTAPSVPGNYNYSCVVCNGKDYDTLLCYLNVGTRLSIKTLINGVNGSEYKASPNEEVILSVEATSDAPKENITYQWFSEDDEEEVLGTDASLEVTAAEGKYYYCKVTDGTNTGSVGFQIKMPPFMIEGNTLVMEVETEKTQKLSVYVNKYFSEDDDIVLCYLWQKYTASKGWEPVPEEEMKLTVDDTDLTVVELTTDPIEETTTYRFSVWDDYEEWEDSVEYIIKVAGTEESKYGIVALNKENAFSISVGDTMKAVIPYTNAQAWFKFVPEATGEYTLPTMAGDKYIYTHIHDEYGNISPSYDKYSETMNVELEAGRTYYLQAGFHVTANGGPVSGVNWLPYQIVKAEGSCNWDNGVVTKAPTCTEDGIKTYTCKDADCGKTYTEKVPMSGHSNGTEQTLETDTFVKVYKICQACGTETLISMTAKNTEEQEKITDAQEAMDALENGASGDVSAAVDAVVSMDNQLLIDMEESAAEGTDTAMKLVEDLEKKLLDNSDGITGTIAASTVKTETTSVTSQNVAVSGAAVTVAYVLKAAENTGNAPDADTEYKAELAITEKKDSSVEDGVYSIDISLDVVAADSGSVFADNVQPEAPICITMPIPESFWNCEFELLHDGTKVNYVRNDNQTISFYAASLSPWTIEVTKCPDGGHNYEVSEEKSVEATCKNAGKTVSVCKRCKDEISTPVPQEAHAWSEWKTVQNAACTEKGVQERICENDGCGKKEKKDIPSAGGHKWKTIVDKAAGCAAAGSQHRECTVCPTKEPATTIPATGKHSYGNYRVTEAATAVAEGLEVSKCANCPSTISRPVKKLDPKLTLTYETLKLQVKKSVNLTQVVTGLEKGDSIASWKSDKEAVATVDKNGKVTGKKVGTAKITVTLASGKTGVITISVQKKAVKTTAVEVNKTNIQLKVGEKFQLVATPKPITTFEKPIYTTSKKSVATVNSKNGLITAKKPGKATITIKCGGKKIKSVTVIVLAPELKGITNVPATKTIRRGKSFTLKPKLTPTGATGKISYKSSDISVATVSTKGKVKAKKAGSVTITVAVGKIEKTCKVTVK